MAIQSFRLLLSIRSEHPNARLFDNLQDLRAEMRRWMDVFPGAFGATLRMIAPPELTLSGREDQPLLALSRRLVLEERVAAITVDLPPGITWDDNDIQRYAETVLNATGIVSQSDCELQSAFWAPGEPFGTRSQALELIGLRPTEIPSHQPVNVVICDQGFDGSAFPGQYSGGIEVDGRKPGMGRGRHAMMIARLVHDIAPNARLYDCPLIPTPQPGVPASIRDIPAFTLGAAALVLLIDAILTLLKASKVSTGSWVFVNSWAIFDTASDIGLPRYGTDRTHILNFRIAKFIADHSADVVFAAGNCGQFAPDNRCGVIDCGPDRSILGANSLSEVVTASAVRLDRTWLGYSSQGQGQPSLGRNKPDLCAPSQFADDDDAFWVSTGTSAAAGIVGGVIALLRGTWDQASVSPVAMKQALLDAATPPNPAGIARRTGAGIVNLAGAAAALSQSQPNSVST